VALLQRYFNEFDVAEIVEIKIPSNMEEDFVAWHYEKTGYFSVRRAYRLGIDLRDAETVTSTSRRADGERPAWKKLWTLPVPHKVRVFAWRVTHNGLATQANKKARRMALMSTCTLALVDSLVLVLVLVFCTSK
jgi:hypothetical protein